MAAPSETDVSPEFPFDMKKVSIFGSEMAYVDTQPSASSRSTPTALFIHGNGSSSYVWRNVIPHVSPVVRCVAPDLIGMGESSKPAHMPYRLTDHYTFLSAFISAVIPSGPILLIVHDWGSALGLHWAYQQAELSAPAASPRVLGLALMEFIRAFPTWKDFGAPEPVEKAFRGFRDPAVGRQMIIEKNMVMEHMVTGGAVRKLSELELENYKRPFPDFSSREPLYMWPNQLPIEGHPSDVYDITTRYEKWLLESDVPKLLFWVENGPLVSPEKGRWYVEHAKNMKGVDLGVGLHFVTEDHPNAIGSEIRKWAVPLLRAA